MQDALERARKLVAFYDGEVAALLPKDAEIFDVHVHVGTDIDGFVSKVDDLLAPGLATTNSLVHSQGRRQHVGLRAHNFGSCPYRLMTATRSSSGSAGAQFPFRPVKS